MGTHSMAKKFDYFFLGSQDYQLEYAKKCRINDKFCKCWFKVPSLRHTKYMILNHNKPKWGMPDVQSLMDTFLKQKSHFLNRKFLKISSFFLLNYSLQKYFFIPNFLLHRNKQQLIVVVVALSIHLGVKMISYSFVDYTAVS